ncbi:hypothetical protein [Flavobacterium sp. ACAM 123]|uniref:hypothetical protein n=1 Tax=Flavobacterium sp. ACAM 123 TaxID=1189620 RepID=UPI0002E3902A|nr:hypothetical protein [Flavobacterium sp. ACAM 123]
MEIREVNIKNIAQYCMNNVFRKDTDKPGFVHLDFGKQIGSNQLRTIMVELKTELSKCTITRFDKRLAYQWLGRFDQQVSTPFHLDNAGDQSFLMLGYEPSEIQSKLYLADYHKFSRESEAALKDDAVRFNPIIKEDESALKPYISEVSPFDKDSYKIVLINNSNSKSNRETLGVFHMASIIEQDLSKSRVINSMMLNMIAEGKTNENGSSEEEFKNTDIVSI